MARDKFSLVAFNRGLISRLGLARVDLKRTAFSAEEMVNWMPRVLGSMMLRPGLGYIGATDSNNATRNLPFVRSASAKYVIELTANIMRVLVDGSPITRGSVSTFIINSTFDSNLTWWTDNDAGSSVSQWVAGGYMGLLGDGTDAAIRDQTVTVVAADQGDEHALRVVVQRGPVILRVGTGTTDDSYINETELGTGTHSLAFTPTGDFNIRLMNRLDRQVLVDSCSIEASGAMTLPTPWTASDLDSVRAGLESQSVDVLFVACTGFTQRRIERRGNHSWSIVQYLPDNGPFRIENTGPLTLTGSALSGNITLTASAALFKSTQAPTADNAGALFRLTSQGQTVTQTITAQNTFTNAIKVTGVDNTRIFTITISALSGTGSTVTLQKSFDSSTGPWTDHTSYTADYGPTTFDDGLDNQIVWYRIGVKTGGYAAGTIITTLSYAGGSIDGIARVTAFTSSTVVDAEVLSPLGSTSATDVWAEGEWSVYRGWPSAGAIYESRMWWAGLDKIHGSITDELDSFDSSREGDSGPISRSVGAGPVEIFNWIAMLKRPVVGGQLSEFFCNSSNFDEPLTPTNFSIKPTSSQGSAGVQHAKIDDSAVFVQRGGTRLFELLFNSEKYAYDARDLCQIVPEIGKPRIVRVGIQRQPDTRIHCIRSDGTAALLVYDQAENVYCWLEIETTGASGLIEDVVVLPGDSGDDEDEVYYTVKRTVNGSTVRYIEKWAMESECIGGTTSKVADSFVTFTNSPASATVSGLTHLVGASVIVWTDGKCLDDASGDIATFTVSASGTITLTDGGGSYSATTGVVGLAYRARWQGAKLGTALTAHKTIDHLGLILADTHAKGLQFGPDFTHLDYLSLMYQGTAVDVDTVYSAFDEEPFIFPGTWSTDSRVCLEANAPRPVTILAGVAHGQVND